MLTGTHTTQCYLMPTPPSVDWCPHHPVLTGAHTTQCYLMPTPPSVDWCPHHPVLFNAHTTQCYLMPTPPSVCWCPHHPVLISAPTTQCLLNSLVRVSSQDGRNRRRRRTFPGRVSVSNEGNSVLPDTLLA